MIFFVDTCVMTPKLFRPLLEASATHGHKVQVPALIYAERLFQLRRRRRGEFDMTPILTWFENFPLTLSVQGLDTATAESLAAALHARFLDDEAWLAAKRATWRRCLGQHVAEEPGARRECGGPVDAYVIGLASLEQPIVTEDDGPEWKGWPIGTVLNHAAALQRAELP